MKDAVATMGGLLPDDVGGRDAVHVAVLSAVAGGKLYPGQDVGFSETTAPNGERVALASAPKLLGIVDPFIKGAVLPDQRIWVYLYPRTITGLNHQWTHPDLPDGRTNAVDGSFATKLRASEDWLRDFTENSGSPSYETLIAAIKGDWPRAEDERDYCNFRIDGEYLHFGGVDAHGEIPSEFWDHVEIVTGKKAPPVGDRPTYFSCSC